MNTYTFCKCGRKMRSIAKECRQCWQTNLSQKRLGKNNNRFGIKLSNEIKSKISLSNKQRILEKGSWGFKKGQPSWNKGKECLNMRWSPERKAKMKIVLANKVKSQIGKKHSLEQRRKISEALKGDKAPNWQGGITYLNKGKARQNVEWKIWHEICFKRDNYACRVCLIKGRIELHHIKKWSKYPELRHEVSNGITLCEDCHHKVKNKEEKIQDFFYQILNQPIQNWLQQFILRTK